MGPCLSKPSAAVHTFDAFDLPSSKWQPETIEDDSLMEEESAKSIPSNLVRMKSRLDSSSNIAPKLPKPHALLKKQSFISETWCLYLDENHIPYFYNEQTGESQWTVPPELSSQEVFKYPGYVTVTRPIPPDGIPGTNYSVEVYGQYIDLEYPGKTKAGDAITMQFELYVEPDGTNYLTAVAEEEEDIAVDPIVAWTAMAEAAGENLALIEKAVTVAKGVLGEVSSGCYLDNLIFQLTWSYRMAQLELAIKECYKRGADFTDSSPYDNCKGVPRYEKSGLIEWWQDLKKQREMLDEKLQSSEHDRLLGDMSLFHGSSDTTAKALQASLLSDDNAQILKGLLDRKKQVELDLDNDIARVLAIVSIEGPPPPPTRESLDTVHDYLLEQFSNPEVDMIDMQEDVEEFVSNTLEPRHHFVVDVLTNMALLEFELDSLNKQIEAFTAPPKQDQEASEDAMSGIKDQEDSVAVDKNNEAVQALIASQHSAANELEESLLTKKALAKKALLNRIEQQKLKKVSQLVKEGMSEAEAIIIAQEESEAEIISSMDQLDRDASATLRDFNKKALADLKALGESEEARLSDELLAQKDKRLKSLQERLEKRKEHKTMEIVNSNNSENIEADIDKAHAEIDSEAEAEIASINQEYIGNLQASRTSILNDIKAQHDVESERVKNDLLSQQDKTKRALQNRLNQKLQRKASGIIQTAASKGESISPEESLRLAQVQCEASGEIKEETDALARLDAQVQQSLAKSHGEIAKSLKELHDKELKKLTDDIAHQESSQRNALQQRLDKKRKVKEAEIERVQGDEEKKLSMKKELEEEEIRANEECNNLISKMKEQHSATCEELGNVLLEKHKVGTKKLKERLAKKDAQKAAKMDKTQKARLKVDEIISELKKNQLAQLKRLKVFVEYEKKKTTENVIKSGPANEHGKALLNFIITGDSIVDGFKKWALYHAKAIKSAPTDSEGYVSADEAAVLLSPATASKAGIAAQDSLITRAVRDFAGLIDVQFAEKIAMIGKMKENGASRQKLGEAELRHDDETRNKMLAELQKIVFTCAALHMNVGDLMEIPADSNRPMEKKSIERSDSFELEDESNTEDVSFGLNIGAWFNGAQELASKYADSLVALFEYLGDAHRKLLGKISTAEGNAGLMDLSMDLYDKLAKSLIGVLITAFGNEVKAGGFNRSTQFIIAAYDAAGDIKQLLKSESSGANAALATTVNAIYTKNLMDWVKNPALGATELASINFAPRTLAQSASQTAQHIQSTLKAKSAAMQDEAKERALDLERSLAVKVDIRRKDLQLRLALKKEQREREVRANPSSATTSAAEAQNDMIETEKELKQLESAQAEVSSLLLKMPGRLEDINADGLMAAVEQKLTGKEVKPEDLVELQRQAEAQLGQQQTQKLMQQQLESAEKLDIAMKVRKVKDQKSLQDRLLKRQQMKNKSG